MVLLKQDSTRLKETLRTDVGRPDLQHTLHLSTPIDTCCLTIGERISHGTGQLCVVKECSEAQKDFKKSNFMGMTNNTSFQCVDPPRSFLR